MGLALVAVIAVSVVGTVLVLRSDTNGGKSPNNGDGTSEFASANDTGPANIITEDPTCEAWTKISRDVIAAAPQWNDQDYSVPSTNWTPEQRAIFEARSAALAAAIEKVITLAKQTPHRVMRELYSQYIVYGKALVDAIHSYESTDNYVVGASNRFSATLTNVCDAIRFSVAQESAPLVPEPSDPTDVAALNRQDALEPERFLNKGDKLCSDWIVITERFDKDTDAWRALGSNIRASDWTPEQKAVMDAVAPIMTAYADDMDRVGRSSGNLVGEDLGVFAAQYLRAYVQAIPSITPNYSYMAATSSYLSNAVYWACKADS